MIQSATVNILGISGSLRRGSFNSSMLRAASGLLPPAVTLEIIDLAPLPFYNSDVEQHATPGAVVHFRQRIAAANAVLFAVPEYNFSISGVLKNALEWASRPPSPPMNGKPCALMGATVSPLGTARGQFHLRQICVALNAFALNSPHVDVTDAKKKFDDDGRLTDQNSLDLIRTLLDELYRFTVRLRLTS